MPRITQWERQIGRRLRLRDLFVFFTVVECGSMAKAAGQLGVATPSVSDTIAGLEHSLGVRLLDRTSKGVFTTIYGEAFLRRGHAAFDELRQGVREIESIADPGVGEVRIGCSESLTGYVTLIIERLTPLYPRMRFYTQQVRWPTLQFPELHQRKIDLVLSRPLSLPPVTDVGEDLNTEAMFDDPFVLVAGAHNPWTRRRKIDLSDLKDEPWVFTPSDALAGHLVTHAFESRGLKPPVPAVATPSIQLRQQLASRGSYIAVLPRSILHLSAKQFELKELRVKLSDKPSPVAIVTLANRTQVPAAELFIECAREIGVRLGAICSRPIPS